MPTDAEGSRFNKAIELDGKNPEFYKGRAVALREPEALRPRAPRLGQSPRAAPARSRAISSRVAMRAVTSSKSHPLSAKETERRNQWTPATRRPRRDIEAGYFLIEYYTKKHMQPELRATLEKQRTLVPDDFDCSMDLVKSYRTARKFDEAVALLLELAKKQPARERRSTKRSARSRPRRARTTKRSSGRRRRSRRARRSGRVRAARRALRRDAAVPRGDRGIREDRQARRAQQQGRFALAQLYIQTGTPMKATELSATSCATTRTKTSSAAPATKRSISKK